MILRFSSWDGKKTVEERAVNSAYAQWLDSDVIKIGPPGSGNRPRGIPGTIAGSRVISTAGTIWAFFAEVSDCLKDKGLECFRTDESRRVPAKRRQRIRIRGTIGRTYVSSCP